MENVTQPPVIVPELRIGHKERNITLDILDEAYAEERITLTEHQERTLQASQAKTQKELNALIADLNHSVFVGDLHELFPLNENSSEDNENLPNHNFYTIEEITEKVTSKVMRRVLREVNKKLLQYQVVIEGNKCNCTQNTNSTKQTEGAPTRNFTRSSASKEVKLDLPDPEKLRTKPTDNIKKLGPEQTFASYAKLW